MVVKWDIYWRPDYKPELLYNHFRIDKCTRADGDTTKPQNVTDYNEVKLYNEMYEVLLPDPGPAQESSQNACDPQQHLTSHHSMNKAATLHPSGSNAKRARPASAEPLVSCF